MYRLLGIAYLTFHGCGFDFSDHANLPDAQLESAYLIEVSQARSLHQSEWPAEFYLGALLFQRYDAIAAHATISPWAIAVPEETGVLT